MDYDAEAMHVQDLVEAYRRKTDEELLELAGAQEQLTADAQLALRGELSRRRISIPEDFGASQNIIHSHDSSPTLNTERLQSSQPQNIPDFLGEVLRTYHNHFWLYFKLTLPAVIIGTTAIIVGRHEGREIARHLPRDLEVLSHRTEILEIWVANLSAYLTSWMAFSFSFGAICVALEEARAGFTPSAWRSLLNLRERFTPFLRLCLLLFVLVLMAEAASTLLVSGVFWGFHQWGVRASGFLIKVVSFGTVGLTLLVLTRFALAVPAVILDDYRVGQSMFRSDELARGKLLTLAALLAKSLIGGYIAGMCPFWLASFIHVTVPLPSWFSWILTAASIIGVTLVEPTMFVGFALLYLKFSDLGPASNNATEYQLA
jgi:hypothetical protein